MKHDLAATLTGTRPHVQDAIRSTNHIRIVLYHQQRIAGIAQALQHTDQSVNVARMQPDAGFIQHEQRIDQRRAQSCRQINTLHLAPTQRSRLAVQRQIAQAHIDKKAQAGTNFREQHVHRCIHPTGQDEALK